MALSDDAQTALDWLRKCEANGEVVLTPSLWLGDGCRRIEFRRSEELGLRDLTLTPAEFAEIMKRLDDEDDEE